MKIIKSELLLKKNLDCERSKNNKINFVPTMGSIHKGHEELIKSSKRDGAITVVSIFLNKLQFSDVKDYENYPVDLNSDLKILKTLPINYVFVPNPKKFVNDEFSSLVKINTYEGKLCDKIRRGHFQGVSTIITKFLILLRPDLICLGEKDFQQTLVIKKLINDFNFKTKVFVNKTIREDDGLAYSSRNLTLSVQQRKSASQIYESLTYLKKKLTEKHFDLLIIKNIKSKLKKNGFKIYYFEILKEHNLEPVDEERCGYRAFISVDLGGVNLIDNLSLGVRKFR